jgi:hypothetical protein
MDSSRRIIRHGACALTDLVALLASPPRLLGQNYGMSFSVYQDDYGSNAGTLRAISTTQDNSWGCMHWGYQTTLTIYSPSGRQAQGGGVLGATANLALAGEHGNYSVSTSGTYHCSCIGYLAGWGVGDLWGVRYAHSFFTNPRPAVPGCWYPDLACNPGTMATGIVR